MKIWRALRKPKTRRQGFAFTVETLNQYVDSGDYERNAVDLVPGWNCRVPLPGRDLGGSGVLYEDPRIHWAIEQAGGVAQRRVLEIGPLEANHTVMLERAGADVTAVEANKLAFMRCLIVKELCRLRSRFILAEVNDWLDRTDERFDVVVACGVLYHMREPVEFLRRLGRKTDTLYIWTHYFEGPLPPRYARTEAETGRPAEIARSYRGAAADPKFCGGVLDSPRWMSLAGILDTLSSNGFDQIETAHLEPGHRAGASVSIFARRSAPQT